ncbi:MAG: RibD family protein, partial [Ornithinimicrobium sp.]
LAQRGVRVDYIQLPEAEAVVQHWAFAVRAGRPWVTWKFAATLDGRVAASDGSSAWVTSAASRADVHALRSRCGAIMVGTGTVLADNPTLTARHEDGSLYADQPLRVVVGRRDLPERAHLSAPEDHAEETTADVSATRATAGPSVARPLHLRTHEVTEVLDELHTRGVHRVLLEGGPTLASALWRAGCVDEVVAYLAPALLGSGASAVGDLGITTMAGMARLDLVETVPVGPDLRITAHPRPTPQED